MGKTMTRATIIWFVGAAVVGAAAGGLHLLRSQIGGAHTGLPLAVSAYALTALAAAMLFHGVMVAAREQDAAAGPAPELFDEDDDLDDDRYDDEPDEDSEDSQVDEVDEVDEAEPVEPETVHHAVDLEADDLDDPDHVGGPSHDQAPDFYTFRGGKPVKDRPRRTGRTDRSPRS